MLSYLRSLSLRKRENRESGASAVEYGLMVAAIAAVIVVIVFALGTIVRNSFSSTCTNLATGTHAQGATGCAPAAP